MILAEGTPVEVAPETTETKVATATPWKSPGDDRDASRDGDLLPESGPPRPPRVPVHAP